MANVVFNRFSNPYSQPSPGYNPMRQMFTPPRQQSMANTQMFQNQTAIERIKDVYKTVQDATDPAALINGMMEQIPQVRETLSLVRQHNGNAQEAFYAKAKEMGIDPEQVLNVLR